MNKQRLSQKIGAALEIPLEILEDAPRLTITGTKELTILNHKGIIEYDSEVIRVNVKGSIIKIVGIQLNLKNITDEEIQINGLINAVEYDTNMN